MTTPFHLKPTCEESTKHTIPSEEYNMNCAFVKYNTPVKVVKKSSLIDSADIPTHGGSDSLRISALDLSPDICKMAKSKENSIDEKARKLLAEEFPVRIKKVGNDIYASTVRETQASPLELAELLNDLRMTLTQRNAKDYPLCNIREELLYCLGRELLRQLIIECPERGILFKKILEEHYKYFEAYEVLLHHNEAFVCRKELQAKHVNNTQLARKKILEEEIAILKQQAKTLKEAADRMEKKYQEERIRAESQRQNELRYQRQLAEQLKSQVEAFAPNADET